jgi:hypothetical protein
MLHHQILLWRSHFSSLAALFVGGKKTEIKKKTLKFLKTKKNAFLFVNNKYHHELLLFAGKRRSSCDDTENINNEY